MTYEFTAAPLPSHQIKFLCDRPEEFCYDDYLGTLDAPIRMPAGSCEAGSFQGIAHQSTVKRS